MAFVQKLIFALVVVSTAALARSPLIAVDVGHGVKDSGALSARGRSEFAFNRDFAAVLADRLRDHGLLVREINFSGDIGSLAARPLRAVGSDFFISIHHDSISERYLQTWDWDGSETSFTEVKRGFGLFVSENNPDLSQSLLCASAMGAMLRRSGFVPTPWHGRKHLPADVDNGVWYYNNLVVLYRTTLPAVLFEAGVIKHREEELELLDPERQARMADALASGIAACHFPTGKSVPE